MIPPMPPPRGPEQDGGTASLHPRYEDITQDGRLVLTALMPGLGEAIWRSLISKLPATKVLRSQGIVPILSRMIAVGEDRPVSVDVPIRYTGSFRYARERGGERIFANMWLEAHAPIASTFGPLPGPDAPLALVGRVFAEHVVTRPFAPPGERKVTRLDVPGLPPIPEDEHLFETAEQLVESAGGALESAGEFQFGMMHTDSNQHVNSLVYPRVFEEHAVRRFMLDAAAPTKQALLARALDIRWRRPFFAGDRAKIAMRFADPAAAAGWKLSAVGAFQGDAAKPSTTLKMCFR